MKKRNEQERRKNLEYEDRFSLMKDIVSIQDGVSIESARKHIQIQPI